MIAAVLNYQEGEELKHCSCMLPSECTSHDATAVYLSQVYLIPAIRKKCQKLTKLICLSDGAKQHFKNRYQMVSLKHHKEDFSIESEWHTHGTAHGKVCCDGVTAIQ